MGYWRDIDGWDYFWMAGMMGIWAVIIVGGFWVALEYFRRGTADRMGPPASAKEELDRRLAAGEITEDEYTRRRDLIGQAR